MAILKNETIKKNIIEAESAEDIIKYLQTEDK
jgi:hypothetical protein